MFSQELSMESSLELQTQKISIEDRAPKVSLLWKRFITMENKVVCARARHCIIKKGKIENGKKNNFMHAKACK